MNMSCWWWFVQVRHGCSMPPLKTLVVAQHKMEQIILGITLWQEEPHSDLTGDWSEEHNWDHQEEKTDGLALFLVSETTRGLLERQWERSRGQSMAGWFDPIPSLHMAQYDQRKEVVAVNQGGVPPTAVRRSWIWMYLCEYTEYIIFMHIKRA